MVWAVERGVEHQYDEKSDCSVAVVRRNGLTSVRAPKEMLKTKEYPTLARQSRHECVLHCRTTVVSTDMASIPKTSLILLYPYALSTLGLWHCLSGTWSGTTISFVTHMVMGSEYVNGSMRDPYLVGQL